MKKTAAKIFNIDNLKGLKAAERYKSRMNNQYDKVTVTSIGFDRIMVEGSTESKGENADVR